MRNSSFLFLLFIISTIFSCREKADDSKAVYSGPKSELFGIDMVYSDSARKVVRMVTEEQLTLASEDRVYPKEMKLWFYDKTGKITSEVRGDSAHFYRQKNTYKLIGHVVIHNIEKEETLKTDEFNWLPVEKRIFTDKAVQLRTRTELVNGVGLDAAQDFSSYSLRKVRNSVVAVEGMPTN
ncbi:LPS export ABC transporter periplasmic protein LptC [Aquirufa lenticrescens]|jgi:LPS export ABC transporter protein LptC